MEAGEIHDGRYELVRQIGEGGMGAVWEARQTATGRRVALKTVHEHLQDQDRVVARLAREARVALEAQRSGHVIEVLELVRPEGQAPYLVMEYLEGDDLGELLRREGRLEPGRAVDLMIQACHALEAVHREGVVHRDVKPDNLHVTRLADGGERLKLLDFGVAKVAFPFLTREPTLTNVGWAVGTPHYMAPEQARGSADLDARVDVYAAGVVLYELLTGSRPFTGADDRAVMAAIVKGSPASPSALRPELDEGLAQVVLRAIAHEREARYGSAQELAEALAPYSTQAAPLVAEARGRRDPRTRLAQTRLFLGLEPLGPRPPTSGGRRPLMAILVALLALATAIGTAGAILASPEEPVRTGALGRLDTASLQTPAAPRETAPASLTAAPASLPAAPAAPTAAAVSPAAVATPTAAPASRTAALASSPAPRGAIDAERRALAIELRPFGPAFQRCLAPLRRARQVSVRISISRAGAVTYQGARPGLPASVDRCLHRAARSRRIRAPRAASTTLSIPLRPRRR